MPLSSNEARLEFHRFDGSYGYLTVLVSYCRRLLLNIHPTHLLFLPAPDTPVSCWNHLRPLLSSLNLCCCRIFRHLLSTISSCAPSEIFNGQIWLHIVAYCQLFGSSSCGERFHCARIHRKDPACRWPVCEMLSLCVLVIWRRDPRPIRLLPLLLMSVASWYSLGKSSTFQSIICKSVFRRFLSLPIMNSIRTFLTQVIFGMGCVLADISSRYKFMARLDRHIPVGGWIVSWIVGRTEGLRGWDKVH